MLYEESANHYGNATEVLELRVKNIKTRIEEAEQQDKGKGKAEDDDPLVKDRKELAELEELLPEIKEKVSRNSSLNSKLILRLYRLDLALYILVMYSILYFWVSC